MRIKAIYRKNLKMSEGKVASQVSHAVKNLGVTPLDSDIIVLKVSDKKFEELTAENKCYIQRDKGLSEVENNTPTAAAWIESGGDTDLLSECIRLFDNLTPQEKMIVMDKTCSFCGEEKVEFECKQCKDI